MHKDKQPSQLRSVNEMKQLVHKRTAELRQENHRRKIRLYSMASVAASFLLILCLGALMSQIAGRIGSGSSAPPTADTAAVASILGNNPMLGYIVMGILCFLLGCCVTYLLYMIKRKNR